ncbi:MAG: FkbM family methyltransferase, partial [Bacteroidia bacterium]
FNNTRLFGGIAIRHPEANFPKVKMVKLDDEIIKRNLLPPYFLKFDTHGFEVPILNGLDETLKQTELVVMEVYNFKSGTEGLKFQDMIALMETKGFLPIDMVDHMHRIRDKAFWQMDVFFVRSSRKEFESAQYE